MKRFVFSALACTALACPAFADDQLFVVECPAEPETPIAEVERTLVAEPGEEVPLAEADATTMEDAELGDPLKEDDIGADGPVDITAVIDVSVLMYRNDSETDTESAPDDGEIIYYNTMSTTGGETTATSLSVDQLANEQRESLRRFSGREAVSEPGRKAGSLRELFAGQRVSKSKVDGRAAALTVSDRETAKRKAEIDQMRDTALRTGDAALMSRADAMASSQPKTGSKLRKLFGFGQK